jgi:hypothetical protein
MGEGQIELRQVIEDPVMFTKEAAKLREKSEKRNPS